MTAPTREAQELLDKLAELSRQIEGYRATIAMLEYERLRLQTALRATGYRPPAPEVRE
jgi:hypothetical protein